jgi:allophanate hydrolase subunit 1
MSASNSNLLLTLHDHIMTIDEYLNHEDVIELMDSIMVKGKVIIKTQEQQQRYNDFLQTLRNYARQHRSQIASAAAVSSVKSG